MSSVTSKKIPKIHVVDYFVDFQMGICAGSADLIKARATEKDILDAPLTVSGPVTISKENLFGGEKKGGGMTGQMTYMRGESNQLSPAWLAAIRGNTPSTHPGYRGLTTVAFGPRFRVAINDPRFSKFDFTVKRAPVAPLATPAMVDGGVNGADGSDANPAHIILECIINPDWGMGNSAASVDSASFDAVAATLQAEGLGLSLKWITPSTIQQFIETVLSHITAVMYIDRSTGLFVLKLLRDDYGSPAALREINTDNAVITKFQRKDWSESTNEVVIKYTNPESWKSESATFQDLAAISAAGQIVSKTHDYPGVTKPELAEFLGRRDIANFSTPLATIEANLHREFWDISPGETIRVTWPDYDLLDNVYRVLDVDYGKYKSPYIKVKMTEDIFALDKGDTAVIATNGWSDLSTVPTLPSNILVMYDLPIFKFLGDANAYAYPKSYKGAVYFDYNTWAMDVYANVSSPSGSISEAQVGSLSAPPSVSISSPLIVEPISTVNVDGDITLIKTGDVLLINSPADPNGEIVVVEVTFVDSLQLRRGCQDTIPKAWGIGSRAFNTAFLPFDGRERVDGETVNYRIVGRNNSFETSANVNTSFGPRMQLPFRPANVKVNGVLGLPDAPLATTTACVVTWSNRNRLTEDASFKTWTDINVTPEVNQTTTLTLKNGAGSVMVTAVGVAGTTHTFPYDPAWATNPPATLEVKSVRDGFTSLHTVVVNL